MNVRFPAIALLSATSLLMAPPAMAAAVIDQNQNVVSASLAGVRSNSHPLQSFQTMANNISGGGFYLSQINGANPVTMEIGLWDMLPTDPGAIRLAFGLVALPALILSEDNPQWVDAFWSPIASMANTTYYLSIDVTDAGVTGVVGGVAQANPYTNGELFLRDSGTEYLTYGSDTAFRTYTDVVASGVPEPASWALMLAGFGLVGGAMRHRRGSAPVSMTA